MPFVENSTNRQNQKLEELMKPHRTWGDVVGNRDAVLTLQRLIERGTPQPLLITGEMGTGKTSLAHLYAKYFAPELYTNSTLPNIYEVTCQGGLQWHATHRLVAEAVARDNYPGRRVILIDEAHRMATCTQALLATHINTHSRNQLYILMASRAPADMAMRQRLTHIGLVRLNASERSELIRRAFADERLAHILWMLTEAQRDEFIAAVNRWDSDVPRNIYNALDEFVLGVKNASDCVEHNLLK
jgi:replication-associated recombination protein RarA